MPLTAPTLGEKSRLAALLDHFAMIEDPREPWRVAHPLPEILLLAVCGTIADCDDYEHIAAWGEAHLEFLREILAYHHGVPDGRWLTLLMNRIDPALFGESLCAWTPCNRPRNRVSVSEVPAPFSSPSPRHHRLSACAFNGQSPRTPPINP